MIQYVSYSQSIDTTDISRYDTESYDISLSSLFENVVELMHSETRLFGPFKPIKFISPNVL